MGDSEGRSGFDIQILLTEMPSGFNLGDGLGIKVNIRTICVFLQVLQSCLVFFLFISEKRITLMNILKVKFYFMSGLAVISGSTEVLK